MGFDIGGVATLTSTGAALALNGASNWMNVNASGILTRPQTPFFRGQLTGRGTPYNGGGGSLLVTADENTGGCWNNATGYFTCPVLGYYMVTLGNIANAQSGYVEVQRNGGQLHFIHWSHLANWHYVSLSCVAYCAAGDNLRYLITSPNPATAGFYGDGGHGMYSIALMA